MVKIKLKKKICLPVQDMQETLVLSLGEKDPLEEEMQPTPVFLPGRSHGQRSLVGYSPRGHRESDMNEPQHAHTPSSVGMWLRVRV